MGLQSALSTALTGLRAAETTIDVVGNNVANSQTVGFKESSVNFATQFLQTQSIGAAPGDASGGTNPRQIGLGVRVAEITPDFTQGTIEISSNPLDVAIQGEGFLIVQGAQGGQFYTRNGQLKTNENNEVITVTGQRVLGYNAEDGNIIEDLQPLRIPIGETAVAQATENVTISGTLTPTSSVGTPGVIESVVLGTSAIEAPDDTNFTIDDIRDTPIPNVSNLARTSVTAGASPPNPAAGLYSYRVVFVDAQGNEGASSIAQLIDTTSDGDGAINLSGIPTADGTNYTSRNIYRTTSGGSGDFFFVGSIPDAATTTFTDAVEDSALGATLDESAVDQTAYSYYVTFYDPSTQTETRPTNLIGTITPSQAGQRIRLSDIPQPDADVQNGVFSKIRIYRNTDVDSSQFYRVDEIDVGETVYMDNRSDASITNPANLIDLDGPKINQSTRLVDVQQRTGTSYDPLFEVGTLSFAGRKGDRTLEAKQLEITASTTVQEWIEFMNQALGVDTTVDDPPISSVIGGRVRIESNDGIENSIQIPLSAFTITPAGDTLISPVSVGFSPVQPAADGEGSTTDFIVYDSLGIPLTVRITTTLESKDANNTFYRWTASSPDNEPSTGVATAVGTGILTFDGSGNLVENGGNTTIAVLRNATASLSPLDFDLDFGQVSGLANTNNLGESNSTLNIVRQDGFPPGVLTSFAVTETGEIRGVFSNGIEETLGQIRMARFTNNAGLQQSGNNLFSQGVNSGEPQLGDPGENGLGSLTAGAVELSNTDIGQNLIELILASTQYRGGARVITAVQELLDELLALSR